MYAWLVFIRRKKRQQLGNQIAKDKTISFMIASGFELSVAISLRLIAFCLHFRELQDNLIRSHAAGKKESLFERDVSRATFWRLRWFTLLYLGVATCYKQGKTQKFPTYTKGRDFLIFTDYSVSKVWALLCLPSTLECCSHSGLIFWQKVTGMSSALALL